MDADKAFVNRCLILNRSHPVVSAYIRGHLWSSVVICAGSLARLRPFRGSSVVGRRECLGEPRKLEMERRPAVIGVVLRPQSSAVDGRDGSTDRQSEAEAVVLGGEE